jgi:hypothetical protein
MIRDDFVIFSVNNSHGIILNIDMRGAIIHERINKNKNIIHHKNISYIISNSEIIDIKENKVSQNYISFEDICRIVNIKIPCSYKESYIPSYKKLLETKSKILETKLIKQIIDYL